MTHPNPGAFTSHSTTLTSTTEVCLADASGLAVLAKGSSTPPATADAFQVGCLFVAAGSTAATPSVYMNTGTSAAPVWTLVGASTLPSTAFVASNKTGAANNAISVSLWAVGTSVAAPVTTGTRVAILLRHSLQKLGVNTLNLNGTSANIVCSSNPTTTLASGYSVGGIIEVVYTPGVAGGVYQDLKQ